ncbi:putative zinc finger protein, partial [Orchesella cincta]
GTTGVAMRSQKHGELKYSCKICGMRFQLAADKKKHLATHKVALQARKHHLQRTTICQTQMNIPILMCDMLWRKPTLPSQCSYVTNAFTKISGLYVGPILQKQRLTTIHLYSHIRTHLLEKPFRCRNCESSYKNSSSLWRHRHIHIRRHVGEKAFKCDVCPKAFVTLWAKLRTTTSSRQQQTNALRIRKVHACVFCGRKQFATTFETSYFRVTYFGKALPCDFFFSAGDQRNHLRIHTGKNYHECEVCKKSFLSSSYLTRHLKVYQKASQVSRTSATEPSAI